jgi:hypothetical protein
MRPHVSVNNVMIGKKTAAPGLWRRGPVLGAAFTRTFSAYSITIPKLVAQ